MDFDQLFERIKKADLESNLTVIIADENAGDIPENLRNPASQFAVVFSNNDPANQISILNDLGEQYREQGLYQQAETLLQRAIVMGKQTFALKHPEIATSLNNLAFVYSDQGKNDMAEVLYLRALDIGR